MESNPNEHMTTARTTEEDNPVRKANPHNKRITDRNKNGFKNRHLIHKGDRTNSNRAEIKPICSPESASTWLAPATEYVSTILSLSSSLSPIVSAESTANSSPRNPCPDIKQPACSGNPKPADEKRECCRNQSHTNVRHVRTLFRLPLSEEDNGHNRTHPDYRYWQVETNGCTPTVHPLFSRNMPPNL